MAFHCRFPSELVHKHVKVSCSRSVLYCTLLSLGTHACLVRDLASSMDSDAKMITPGWLFIRRNLVPDIFPVAYYTCRAKGLRSGSRKSAAGSTESLFIPTVEL